eukprot:SAG11_NODE_489_length_8994_cov_8.385904_3_plen_80_part_00
MNDLRASAREKWQDVMGVTSSCSLRSASCNALARTRLDLRIVATLSRCSTAYAHAAQSVRNVMQLYREIMVETQRTMLS